MEKKNIFISFDPNYRHLLFPENTQSFIDQSWTFLTSCHFFKLSDDEAFLLTGRTTLKDAVEVFFQKTKGIFAITLGKEGTLLGFNGKTYTVSSIPAKPIDTTGAGDAFVGAVLYQLSLLPGNEIRQLPLEQWKQILFNGNKAGARTTEYMGAMEAFKHLSNTIFNED